MFVSEDNSPLLGCYGDPIARTPNIDKFAEKGVRFDNAYANAPVCAPSRSTIITGVYPTSMGTQHMRCENQIPEAFRFFPNYLHDAGYFTTLRLKRDYNIPNQVGTWDIDDWWHLEDAFKGKKEEQPFFLFYNTWMTHEGKVHDDGATLESYFRSTFENDSSINDSLKKFNPFNPDQINIPEYQPNIRALKQDWANYYRCIEMMDYEFGRMLGYLEQHGLMENTIIIYMSDHGGVLPRSKRFTYETGLKVPLIVYCPEKYKSLVKFPMKKASDQLVEFADLAPTVLTLAGLTPPEYMVGEDFLSSNKTNDVAFGFRGRMDESYDMVRTIKFNNFRYIRNYMPFRPSGQNIQFFWKMPSVQAWEKAYLNGECNAKSAAFFESKPIEELYDVVNDPENTINLVNDPLYAGILTELRTKNIEFLKKHYDSGFIPEGELYKRSKEFNIPIYNLVRENKKELFQAINASHIATNNPKPDDLIPLLKSKYPAVRFWGATGSIMLKAENLKIKKYLIELLNDRSEDVIVMASEALYLMGGEEKATNSIRLMLNSQNPYVVLRALNTIAACGIVNEDVLEKIGTLKTEGLKEHIYEYINKKSDYILNRELSN